MLQVYNCKDPSCVDGLPEFVYSSDLTRLPYLSHYDIDEQLPQTIDSRYFTIPEFTSLEVDSSDLFILHTNIRSLSLHHEDLITLCTLTKVNYDIIGISETWNQTHKETLNNASIDGYDHYDTQSLTQNGGVRLYVKNSLSSKLCTSLCVCCNDFETVWVEVNNTSGKNFLFCCAYRHPDMDMGKLTDHFKSILPKLINKKIFIMGDFNINLLTFDSHSPTTEFLNNLLSSNFLPCINHPTRISHSSSTIIDNIFTNSADSDIICGNILSQISYHLPQFLILKDAKMHHKTKTSFKRDYSSFNMDSFITDFTNMDITYIEADTYVDNNYQKFFQDINLLLDYHLPIKRCTKKESQFKLKSWISTKIKKMMRIRDSILRNLKSNRSENNLKYYRKFRNRVTAEIKASKIHCFHNYFSINSQNMKKLWQGIKSIISNNSTTTAIRSVQNTNGKRAINLIEIVNTLNKSFVNVAENISKNIPRTPMLPLDYFNGRSTNSMFLFPVTHIEVEHVISNLDSSKSCGPNSVRVYILKVLGPYISNALATLSNQSFSKGIFPSTLKTAKVFALFKKGDPEMTSNYRPISLSSSFSKL